MRREGVTHQDLGREGANYTRPESSRERGLNYASQNMFKGAPSFLFLCKNTHHTLPFDLVGCMERVDCNCMKGCR